MPVAHENRPEPGFARWGLLRTHDVPNAVFAIEHCEAVAIIRLRCTYESQHWKAYKAVFWPIGDAAWPARAFRNARRLRLLRYSADYLRQSCSDNFLEGTSLTTFPHRITTKSLRKLLEEAVLKSLVAKRSVVIGGHKTSVSLEDPFWNDLKEIAYQQKVTLSQVVEQIDRAREHSNLSSAIRLFVLDQARTGIVGSTLISRSPKLRTG